MNSAVRFNPLAPETLECPFPFYEELRREAPVYQVPGLGFFIVSRYEDAVSVLRNPEIFSSNSGPSLAVEPDAEIEAVMRQGYPPVNTLLTNDPPDHARYRSLVNKAFSARRVARMEPAIREIANDLVDRFADRGSVEFVSEFAVPLPLTMIADQLGVPRKDLATFKRWSDDSVAPLSGVISRERQIECARSIYLEFQPYFIERLEERRREPREDVLSDLVHARLDGDEGKPLDTREMLSIIQQLLVAGNETTTNLLASGMMLLAQHPDQLALALADRSLIPNIVEETLRLESPVQGLFRMAKVDTEVGGVPVPAGSRLIVMYASANRDDAQYVEPVRFDISRQNARTHLAFGHGIHFCLGAALARAEGIIAFDVLLSRLRNLRPAPGKNDFTHVPSFILRGLKELHLEFDPA